MNILKLTDDYLVSGQIDIQDMQEISDIGIKTIICNRPDNENRLQPSFEDIEKQAMLFGIDCFYIPVEQESDPIEIRKEFTSKFNECSKPVLAYCFSGSRSQSVWRLYND